MVWGLTMGLAVAVLGALLWWRRHDAINARHALALERDAIPEMIDDGQAMSTQPHPRRAQRMQAQPRLDSQADPDSIYPIVISFTAPKKTPLRDVFEAFEDAVTGVINSPGPQFVRADSAN